MFSYVVIYHIKLGRASNTRSTRSIMPLYFTVII